MICIVFNALQIALVNAIVPSEEDVGKVYQLTILHILKTMEGLTGARTL